MEADGLDTDSLEDVNIDEDEIHDKYMDKQMEDRDRTNASFDHTAFNVLISWLVMAGYTILYGVISVIALEFVDKDKR